MGYVGVEEQLEKYLNVRRNIDVSAFFHPAGKEADPCAHQRERERESLSRRTSLDFRIRGKTPYP